MADSLWTIIDTESDLEIGTVSYDGAILTPDTMDFDLMTLIDNLDVIDPQEFPDKLAQASGGRFLAIPEDSGAGDEEPFDAELTESQMDELVDAIQGEPEDAPEEPAEAGWVALVESNGSSLGRILVSNAGKLELDITDPVLQSLMMLDVIPALEDVSMLPGRPEYREALVRTIEGLADGEGKSRQYKVETREVLSMREAGGDLPNAVVRWGSTSPQWTGPAAPWAPVPLSPAREYIKANPGAVLEINFPTVFEEDRSAKVKDIMTGDVAGYISHRRASEQYAKEMGFEQYDYEEEQAEISTEKPKAAVPPDLSGGGKSNPLAMSIGSTIGGHLGNAGAKPGGIPQAEDEDEQGRMAAAGDDAQGRHQFRQDQKHLAE